MKEMREFSPTDRYLYDFNLCTIDKGFAQVDTEQDCSYYGTWANPFKGIVVYYIEGDVIIKTELTQTEFVKELNDIKEWNERDGWKFAGIDTGINNPDIKKKFIALGLQSLLYEEEQA